MSSAAAPSVLPVDLREVLADYVQTKACVNAADDEVYVRFLDKQALSENAAAKEQLRSMHVIATLVKSVESELEHLRICGLVKLHKMCEFVRSRQTPEFETRDCWTICSVSSCPTSQCLVFGESSEWTVDISFLSFFRLLWVVFHIEHIEHSKFMHFMASRPPGEKIMESLKSLEQSTDYTPEHHYDTYISAFDYVISTLRNTIATYTARFAGGSAVSPS